MPAALLLPICFVLDVFVGAGARSQLEPIGASPQAKRSDLGIWGGKKGRKQESPATGRGEAPLYIKNAQYNFLCVFFIFSDIIFNNVLHFPFLIKLVSVHKYYGD